MINDNNLKPQSSKNKCATENTGLIQSIFLDDILSVISFDNIILKIYIQGQEHRAFQHAHRLFKHLTIPYIILDWTFQRTFYFNQYHRSVDKQYVEEMIVFFTLKDYKAFSFVTGKEIEMSNWPVWPEKVVLVHDSVDMPHQIHLQD